MIFEISQLAASTNNFSSNTLIGKGGYGDVYKVVYFLYFSYNNKKAMFELNNVLALPFDLMNVLSTCFGSNGFSCKSTLQIGELLRYFEIIEDRSFC